jgi:hypothetical protein
MKGKDRGCLLDEQGIVIHDKDGKRVGENVTELHVFRHELSKGIPFTKDVITQEDK